MQHETWQSMNNLVAQQVPALFHRYYLKYNRKHGDGKADNILMDRNGEMHL